MAKYIELTCAVCKKNFSRLLKYHTSSTKKYGNKYKPICSIFCKKQFRKTSIEISCEFCNKVFEKRLSQINKTEHNFCSQSCSASFINFDRKFFNKNIKCNVCGILFEVSCGSSKKKCDVCIKKSRRRGKRKAFLRKGICIVCNKEFLNISLKLRKTCSNECLSSRLSMSALSRCVPNDERLLSIRCVFSFKDKKIACASKAEYSCLDFIIKNYDILDVDRCVLFLKYELNGKFRNYNPDFIVKLSTGQFMIVECKTILSNNDLQRKWAIYYSSIEPKKKVLEKYCNEHGYEMLFYNKDMNKKFYNSLSRQLLQSTVSPEVKTPL